MIYRLKVGTFYGKKDLHIFKDYNGSGPKMGFSTFDYGNGMGRLNHCAKRFGPWWHQKCSITKISNPNGQNMGLGKKMI